MTLSEETKSTFFCVGAITLGVLGLAIGLIAASFADVNYYEYGFKKSRSTGSVDTSVVYTSGRHFVGPDKTFKTFQSTAHLITLDNILIFSRDKLEIGITVDLQYFLNKDDLPELHDEYDLFYEEIFKQTAKDTVKGAVTSYSTREFFEKRAEIEQKIFLELRKRFSGSCCEPLCNDSDFLCIDGCIKPRSSCTKADKGLFSTVKYFVFGQITIPRDVSDRFQLTLIRQLETEKEAFVQDEAVVRKKTQQKVRLIENEAREVRRNATAKASFVSGKAETDAQFLVNAAHRDGLKSMYTSLGISDEKQKASINYIRSLTENEAVRLTVGFQELRLSATP